MNESILKHNFVIWFIPRIAIFSQSPIRSNHLKYACTSIYVSLPIKNAQIMAKRNTFLTVIWCISAIVLSGQHEMSLVQNLEIALFPQASKEVFLYEYLSDCNRHTKVDSSIRLILPTTNYDTIMKLFEQIYWEHDTTTKNTLISLYSRQMEWFKKELGSGFVNSYHNSCGRISQQFEILTAFEHTLHSFELSALSDKEVFEYFLNHTRMSDSLSMGGDIKRNIIPRYRVYSEDYRNFNSRAWFRFSSPFHFSSYHQKRMEPYMVQFLENCNWRDSISQDVMILWHWKRLYINLDDIRISKALVRDFRYWRDSGRQVFAYSYASSHYYPELVKVLYEDWLAIEPYDLLTTLRKENIHWLLDEDQSAKLVIDLLIKTSAENPDFVAKQLKYFPQTFDLTTRLQQYGSSSSEKLLAKKLLEAVKQNRHE
jgi:hypothetical protein